MTERLNRPVDLASLAAFRIVFGLVLFVGQVRFLFSGWIEAQYVRPTYFFKYAGFEWVQVWPQWGLYLHFGALAVLAACITLGLFYRPAAILFAVGFAYTRLMDVTNYLNHEYLEVLLVGLMALMPLHGMWSLDARRRPDVRRESLPAWMRYTLILQVGLVYFYAALAKLNADWLLHGQPLSIWLAARTETPVFGALFAQPWAPVVMSWAGFLYDLTIPLWLLWPKTRRAAYVVVLGFHSMTAVLFDIGMFPFIMSAATWVFFAPSWPRRVGAPTPAVEPGRARTPRLALAAVGVYCAVQVLLPLRHFASDGDVLWNEVGMRFSWKVMVREKNGALTYHVTDPRTGRRWQVNPKRYLEWRQLSEMSGQPDLVAQLAWHVERDFQARGVPDPEVRAEVWVSLNGRTPQLMLDPSVDLTRPPADPGAWILPAPTEPPR